MFGLRVQSTRQSVHTKDLPATLGHAAHLQATRRDARPSQPTYVSVNASLAKNHLAVCMLYAMQTIALAYTCSALHRSER